jgi:hypothetical protein
MPPNAREERKDILESSLLTILSSTTSRYEFAKGIWNTKLPLEEFKNPHFEDFFRYYEDQCKTALYDVDDEKISHRNIAEIARGLASSHANDTDLQQTSFALASDSNERYWRSFAARIMTMVDVGGLRHGIRPGQFHREWTSDSLRSFMEYTFPRTGELPDDVKLEKLFNARNLQRFASIQIIWTNNLADHLQLEDDDTSIRIFSHVSFLKLHQDWYVNP